MRPLAKEDDDLNVEVLLDDDTVVAAGPQSRWAHLDKVDLADLVNEPWILTPPDTWIYMIVAEAFRGRELCPGGRLVVLTTATGAVRALVRVRISAKKKSFQA